ncbi:MAG TPA: alpha-hydroxy acid oxidase [Thermoanaerobaculia bacterium]|nr:alpha-hydroxy acid oxidase [Thermoanaerobaculia bacterium]
MSVSQIPTLQEIVRAARANLDQNVWDYLVGGADTETTLRRNRQAIDSLALRPRILRDVSDVRAERELLGHRLRIPVFLPPIGSVQVFSPGGGASVARAAERFGSLQFLSSVCLPELEDVAAVSSAPKVYQLYLLGDDGWMEERILRATEAGYTAFCLTADTQVYSRRERDLLKRYIPRSGRQAAAVGDFVWQARMTWDTVKRIKDRFTIPLVLKGIGTAEDAGLALEHGVDVLYVSNHGGRQLDHGRGSIDVLPEVVAEVAGRAPVLVDGGFLRGTDVVKAIALGATAVGVGRLSCFGLAAGGEEGLVRALEILEYEIRIALALMGAASLADLDPTCLTTLPPIGESHVASAFPHLDLERWRY